MRALSYCKIGDSEKSLADTDMLIKLDSGYAKQQQQYLKDLGFYDGAIDGKFGPGSREAKRKYIKAGCS